MKISFYQQNVPETEKQNAEKAHTSHGAHKNVTVAMAAAPGAVYSENNRNWAGIGKAEKGKSLLDIQQEAEYTNADVQQDYVTLMSHIMSEEDYAKLQEEGFDFRSMDPEEAVTIVDRIKAELARSGKEIKGYTDDIDMETLTAALGSQVLANAVADSFRDADLPMTRENLELVEKAWNMASELEPMDEGASRYLIDNELEPEIWNLYLAQNSGAGASSVNAPQYYAEDVQGYYTRNAEPGQSGELAEQIDHVIEQSGREVNEENRQNASWLLENGLPLTVENLDRLEELQSVQLPVTAEDFAQTAADAIAEGKDPIHANLSGKSENLYEKASRLAEYYHSEEAWERLAGDVTARRQLEEIRLRMTAEVNVKLLKSGFSIDTAPMEELVEALKQVERELAGQYFPDDAQALEKYRSYNAVNNVVEELPGLPAQVIGTFTEGQSTATLEEFHREGKAVQESYEHARGSYETLMTSPRADMGDSIRKAFANVDDILRDLGIEPTEETRRAARILGYNRMEMTAENLASVMEADKQVKSVIEKLTPAAVLKMIRDGINPLEKSFAELESYFEEMPEEYRKEVESYSRFLYGLEQNKAITEAERESYIGIYRLVRQIEKSDGAVVGALVNTQAELHFSNLLSAVRSGKVRSVDVKVADELGTVAELVRKGETISEQIGRAFTEAANKVLTEVSHNEAADREYRQQELEQLRETVANADDESMAMLQRGQLSSGADNLMAAQALINGSSNLFGSVGNSGNSRKNMTGIPQGETTKVSHSASEGIPEIAEGQENVNVTAEVSGMAPVPGGNLWEALDDREAFVQEYDSLTQDALEAVETASLQEADTSLDVRGMQLVHKQLTVASALAKQEEYFIPMYIGETLTRVHLTLDRSGSGRGNVSVGVQLSEESRLEAHFHLENGALKGIFAAQDQNEVMKLQELADTFREEVGDAWSVSSIEITTIASTAAIETETVEDAATENAELYRVAKVFLQAVQKRGI
ncbi:MAG: hypothetical protein J1E01_04965 [Acetatifactor sp.]|nr:hypothetical protein [Acetatifactor sp.]